MNFGTPRIEVREPQISNATSERVRAVFAQRRVSLRGTHWLVMSPATWRLELADGLVVRDTGSVKRLDMAISRIHGEKLDAIVVSARTGATTFYFDLGGRITVRSPAADDISQRELWSLNDKRRVATVLSGGFYQTGSVTRRSVPAERIEADASGAVIVARTERMRRELAGRL
jgi:hypothetical protein